MKDLNDAKTHNNRGVAKHNLGKYIEAIVEYNRAIELDPNYAEAYYNRGEAQYNLGNYDEAVADHDKAIELDPTMQKRTEGE